ncbi:E3 ubiquitin/ISG15 ligase TRIM25 isoform X2 [Conger conger]|uniref:E3 ubiquitin/ISG15 ligase TRIM25 isoform X2 n=1 Tax=Conger conger TaxID=82655 RepID=UPI002A598EE7|nr:E3 ubiquitin/ISG15 ligase TRIM25 isoform X2 [Conger conger]
MSTRLWTEEQFNCPVCLDLPHDPVTIPCGHSYCMDCIKDYWGKDDHVGIYSCPQCRQTFCPKPSLSRNTMLAEAVEQLRRGASDSTPAPEPSSSSSSSSSAIVPCDVCQGDPLPAVKTCLVCLASYCEPHLKPHRQAAALKRHELISPTGQLTQKICPQHKYLQEFYCRSCQAFICWLCTSNQHKDHETTSAKAERIERQKEMGEVQAENQQKLQEREKELKEMKTVVECLKRSADRVHGDSEQILSELQHSLERLQELVQEVMDSRGQDKLRETQDVVEKLEAEIRELKRRDSEMRQLVACEDNIHFLQNFKTLCSPFEGGELPTVTASPDASFEPVCTVLVELRNKIEDLCNQDLCQITKTVENMQPFTLGDTVKNAAGTKFSFLKIFGRSSRNTDKQGTSVTARAVERRGLRAPDVRSRDTRASPRPHRAHNVERREREQDRASPRPRRGRDVERTEREQASQQRGMESQRRADPAVAHPVVHPGAGSVAGQYGGGANGTTGPVTAALIQQVIPNPSLFLDDTPTDTMMNPAFPELTEISLQSLQAPAPRTRAEFLQYACKLTLDPATAHRRISLSEGNTKATLQGSTQPYPDVPTRFDSWTQVMCRDPLTADRCYWEVEWRGRGSAVGVAYAPMARKGADGRAGLGYNALSWSLELSDTCCAAMHHNEKHDIAVGYSPRVGVFLDRRAGTLAFYSVADNMSPLYTFESGFVEALFPAFGVGSGVGIGLDFAMGQFSSLTDSIKICPL